MARFYPICTSMIATGRSCVNSLQVQINQLTHQRNQQTKAQEINQYTHQINQRTLLYIHGEWLQSLQSCVLSPSIVTVAVDIRNADFHYLGLSLLQRSNSTPQFVKGILNSRHCLYMLGEWLQSLQSCVLSPCLVSVDIRNADFHYLPVGLSLLQRSNSTQQLLKGILDSGQQEWVKLV